MNNEECDVTNSRFEIFFFGGGPRNVLSYDVFLLIRLPKGS